MGERANPGKVSEATHLHLALIREMAKLPAEELLKMVREDD